jgi:hypothetical protein
VVKHQDDHYLVLGSQMHLLLSAGTLGQIKSIGGVLYQHPTDALVATEDINEADLIQATDGNIYTMGYRSNDKRFMTLGMELVRTARVNEMLSQGATLYKGEKNPPSRVEDDAFPDFWAIGGSQADAEMLAGSLEHHKEYESYVVPLRRQPYADTPPC